MSVDLVAGFEPEVVLGRITAATERLLTSAAKLGDDEMREASLLPGWSRGHVLTHVARNADGGTRLLTWARTGVRHAEYPSLEARAAEIDAGADRSAAELVADVRESAARFADAYALMPAEAWGEIVEWTAGQRRPAARAADARLTEVLVHHVDLRAGAGPADWPEDFVARQLEVVTMALDRRDNRPALRLHAIDAQTSHTVSGDDPVVVRGPQASLLAWLMGRSDGDDLTSDRPLPVLPFLY
jgi:maleylpyruvate isomerase